MRLPQLFLLLTTLTPRGDAGKQTKFIHSFKKNVSPEAREQNIFPSTG